MFKSRKLRQKRAFERTMIIEDRVGPMLRCIVLWHSVHFKSSFFLTLLLKARSMPFVRGWSKTEAVVKDHTLSGSLRLLVVERCLT